MPLSSGTRLGPYEVDALIGRGGMGEVYRARDTKLNRDVALKVLPDSFADDPQRLARFEREAQVLASLNHPGIAAIYGLEEADGVRGLVLELVEGPTLAERIAGGPIPSEDAVLIARQIAEALEAAHEQGIIHRDLKPANVKVREDGTVKVLDFGLAKALEGDPPSTEDASQSPTLSAAATRAGVILGTAAYMSPEQARGKSVDKRADIWAFGCVLFEMLTGKRPFEAGEISDILAFVLTRDPEWQALPRETPVSVGQLLRRCLEKDAKKRLRDIGEARILLDDVGSDAPVGEQPRPGRLGWIAAAVMAVVALTLGVANLRRDAPSDEAIRFTVYPPEGTTIAPGPAARQLALSRDGRRLAIATHDSSGTSKIWIRDMDSLEARELPGTEGGWFPFWSPDGRFIGFQTRTQLKSVAVSGGPPLVLCDVRGQHGAAWSSSGVIIFSQQGEGLHQVPASGGVPTPLTTLVSSRSETRHQWPQFLPDARHFLYFAESLDDEHRGIYVASLDADAPKFVMNSEVPATYAVNGYLLFLRGATLMAQPFDIDNFTLAGEPSRIAEDVSYNPGTNRTSFSVSETGVLAFRTGGIGGTPVRELVWFDREGRRLGTVGRASPYNGARLSPDESRVAVSRVDNQRGTADIWLLDLARGTESQLTFDPANDSWVGWSPDGSEVVFASNRRGAFDLYEKAASGAGDAELLLESSVDKTPTGWSPDGRQLLFSNNFLYEMSESSISVLSMSGDGQVTPLLDGESADFDGQVSPDGRWLAYVSTEEGQGEVYVQPFPGLEGRWRVSSDGGSAPSWPRDGKELFYLDLDNNLVAVSFEGEETFEVVSSRVLFTAPVSNFGFNFSNNYSATRDGQRFLIQVLAEETGDDPITVIVNWTAALAP